MPSLWGHGKAQKKILDNIVEEFRIVQRKHALSPGDFPNVNRFKQIITQGAYELNKFPVLKPKLIEAMDHVLSVDVPALLKQMPILDNMETQAKVNASKSNPFGAGSGPSPGSGWAVGDAKKAEYMNIFYTLESSGGKASGAACQSAMVNRAQGKFNNQILGAIWELSDIDKDGCLDQDEFSVAMYLIDEAKMGKPTPGALPANLIPPSKRKERSW